MTWYNPFSWFTAAKTEVQTVEQKVETVAIGLETEADNLVSGIQKFNTSSAKELASIKARLEADIAKKQAALEAVNGELGKAQSVVTAPAPAPAPAEPAPQVAA